MWELPSHLASLNTIPSPSSQFPAINPADEEAFWDFMNTDELFENFGVSPATHEAKEEKLRQEQLAAQQAIQQSINHSMAPPPTPALGLASSSSAPTPLSGNVNAQAANGAATLESFIAAFAHQPSPAIENAFSAPLAAQQSQQQAQQARPSALPLPLPFAASGASSAAPTPTLDTALLSLSNFDFSTLGNFPSAPAPTPADVSVSPDEEERERVSGAKKLKSMGAGQAEIEEDKRRRNTEASARFRAKKKEREQALEIRAKELEAKLSALTAENASLSNENRLLKAIVLGSGQEQTLQDALANASAILSAGSNDLSSATLAGKRKRDD